MRFANSHRVRTASVINQQGVFEVLSSFSYDYFGLANSLDIYFVDVLVRWLFARILPLPARPSWMLTFLMEARVSDYTNDVLARSHCYKPIVAHHLRLLIDVKNLLVFMV